MRSIFPHLSHMVLIFLLVTLLAFSTAPVPYPAAAQRVASLHVFPLIGGPGADLYVRGYGFPPGVQVDVVFISQSLPDGFLAGAEFTDSDGVFTFQGSVPVMPDGPADIYAIYSGGQVSTSMTVLTELALSLGTTSGAPGQTVTFSVDNLSPGQLRLDYGGLPLFGPVAIGGTGYNNSFVVPHDRPAMLGDPVHVEAVNLVDGRVVNRTQVNFLSQPLPPGGYAFSRVDLPAQPVKPGEVFTINGQISPPPAFPLNNYQLKVLWKDGSQVLPITHGAPVIQQDGFFQVNGKLPSFFNGDALAVNNSGQVGVALFAQDMNSVAQTNWLPGLGLISVPTPPRFRIQVRDPGGNPVPGAIVQFNAPTDPAKLAGTQPDGGQVSYSVGELKNTPNQVFSYAGGMLFPDETDPFTCAATDLYGKTDAQGYFEPKINWDWVALAGSKILPGYLGQGSYYQVPLEITFSFKINAWHKGLGEVDAQGHPILTERSVRYKVTTNLYYDADTNQVLFTDPLPVTLPYLPPDASVGVPLKPFIHAAGVIKHFDNYVGTGIPMTVYGKFVAFTSPTEFPNAIFPGGLNLKVQFKHDPLLYGTIDETSIKATLDGVLLNPGFYKYPSQDDCSGDTFALDLNNVHRWTAGTHTILVEVKNLAGVASKHYIQIFLAEPPAWFRNPTLQNRLALFYGSGVVSLSADFLSASDPNTSSSVSANVPKIGPLNNTTASTGKLSQGVGFSGEGEKHFERNMPYKVVNNIGGKQENNYATSAVPITYGPKTISILNTGRIPLYRHVIGVEPIAGAVLGADMWFDATLTYSGTIYLSTTGSASTVKTFVRPDATVNVDAFVEASALFGAVEASAHAIPSIGMSLPLEYTNGVKTDNKKCFRYKLEIKWEASLGYCPFCISASGTEPLFDDETPPDCTMPPPAALQPAALNAAPPPAASPSIANDGAGHSLAVWRADDGTIRFSTYTGLGWTTPGLVSGNASSGSPRVAYYAPNQAVALWTQSALTPVQATGASFAVLAQNQRLYFAAWNGSTWSAPQALATGTTTAEGNPSLAACLSTTAGCPAGGAVTAAWVRDFAGDLSQHQYRIYSATFQTGAWGAVQPVDPTSTAADAEPVVVYATGAPVVAWVRDADRNFGTLTDRRLAYRNLNSGGVVQPVDIPAGITEPSAAAAADGSLRLAFTLATDAGGLVGNQRQLYSSIQTCTGGCTWTMQALTDTHERPLFAESPVLTLDALGKGTITYRALGFGPLPGGGIQSFPEDSLGVNVGTGDLAQLDVNFSSSLFTPHYLTNDSATEWQAAAVYDPLVKQVQVVAGQGAVLTAQAAPAEAAALIPGQPLVFASLLRRPDFIPTNAVVSIQHPMPRDPLSVAVEIRNDGAANLLDLPLVVRAGWDADPGVGPLAGEVSIPAPAPGQTVIATISLSTAAVNLDLPHRLHILVNPSSSLPETERGNNRIRVAVGGLPVPQGLLAKARQGGSLVFLDWMPLDDSRVAGYRIYRGLSGGTLLPVGTTFTNAWVDLTAALDRKYNYAMASFSKDGIESTLSEVLPVATAANKLMLPLVISSR